VNFLSVGGTLTHLFSIMEVRRDAVDKALTPIWPVRYRSPMTTDPRNDPDFREPVSKAQSRGGLRLIQVLLALGGLGLLLALLGPLNRGSGRGAAQRIQCVNNFKQIGLALHNYEQDHGTLPPAFTVDAKGRPLHSWRTLILPYMEHGRLYDRIDLSKPWDDPVNAQALKDRPSAYDCPSILSPKESTVYLAVVGPDGCFPPTGCRRLAEITDAVSNTLMVVETRSENAVPWMAPLDPNETMIGGITPETKLQHPGEHPPFVATRPDLDRRRREDQPGRVLANPAPPCIVSHSSNAASGTSQLAQLTRGSNQRAVTPIAVASPPSTRSTTAEHSSR
jgi:hypothetical protein